LTPAIRLLASRKKVGGHYSKTAELLLDSALLHNVPTLIGETNKERHQYFWHKERRRYMDWASAPGRDQAKSRMMTYYQPIWDEMEPLMTQLLDLQTEEDRPPHAGYQASSVTTWLGPQPKRRKG
jgi:hypothetical protein